MKIDYRKIGKEIAYVLLGVLYFLYLMCVIIVSAVAIVYTFIFFDNLIAAYTLVKVLFGFLGIVVLILALVSLVYLAHMEGAEMYETLDKWVKLKRRNLKLEKVEIDGQEYHVLWEVFDENGRFVEEAISEEHAHDIINDAGQYGKWSVDDRLVE